MNEEFTYEFLPWRGVSEATWRFYNSRTKVDTQGIPVSIGFPYVAGFKVRTLDKKDFYWVGEHKPGLFGRSLWAAGSHKTVTITEGELDACSLYQVVRQGPTVSVQSAGSAVADCSADRDWLASFDRIVLAFDNDERGRDAVARVARLFDYDKVFVVKFDGAYKDANDYLTAGATDELKAIWYNARRYLPETIVSSFSDFDEILKEPNRNGVPYPFPTLNEKTYGIRTGESVLITAQEGIGKTEVMHAILHHILKETDSNVGAIFLEEPKRRLLQAVAGLEIGRPVHLPDSECSEDQVSRALKAAIRQDERLHIYSHFGSADPEVIIDTIRFLVAARSCRFILLDHISMVVSSGSEADERRALDRIVTALEMMVKELDYALILVSHVNDEGLTRGSRYISKIADIRIDLHRDVLDSDPVKRNTTQLIVSKNRFSGRTGDGGSLLFDPSTYAYSEVANDNQPAEKAA